MRKFYLSIYHYDVVKHYYGIVYYCNNIIITVRVEASNATFRGLAVQVRDATGSETFSNDAAFVGEFVNPPADGDWQLWACAAVSHLPYC